MKTITFKQASDLILNSQASIVDDELLTFFAMDDFDEIYCENDGWVTRFPDHLNEEVSFFGDKIQLVGEDREIYEIKPLEKVSYGDIKDII